MPRVKGTLLNRVTGKYEKPAEGGAVGVGAAPVREPVKELLGASGAEEDFINSLPDGSTQAETETPKTRKPRKSKTVETPTDPNMEDARYVRAVGKMAGMGGGTVVQTTFTAAGKPLERDEKEDVEDYFYVLGKKGNLDPTGSWFLMFAFFVVMILRLVAARTDIGQHIQDLFTAKDAKAAKEREEMKEHVNNLPEDEPLGGAFQS